MTTKTKVEREHALISRRKLLGLLLGGGGVLVLKTGLDKLTLEDAGGGAGPSAFFQLNDVTKLQPNDGDVWAYQASNKQWLNQAPTGLTSFQHALLSAQHSDTTPAAPVFGDVTVAQGSPVTWSRLAMGTNAQVLQIGGPPFPIRPGWRQPTFGQIGGTLLQSQFVHGHQSNVNTPFGTPSGDQNFTTATFANIIGLAISLKSRNAAQGLFGFIFAIIAFKMSATTIQGELLITEDATAPLTLPISGSTLWTTVLFMYPINSGAGFADNLTHTYQLQARITNPPGTLTIAGATYSSIIMGEDVGTAVNVA